MGMKEGKKDAVALASVGRSLVSSRGFEAMRFQTKATLRVIFRAEKVSYKKPLEFVLV